MSQTFACSFRATELDARQGILSVMSELKGLGLTDGRLDEVQIALAEAINNVIEHAYAGSTAGDVLVQCSLETDQLWVNIKDAGAPFPDNKLPEGKPAVITEDINDLPEGGFGWFLIRELTSDIQYARQSGRNELSLCFEL